MIGNLKFRSYESETELKDRARLKRLLRHAQVGKYMAVILPCPFFGIPLPAGMGWLAFKMIINPKFRPFRYMELILLGLGALSFFFVRAFAKEIKLDPIPSFLREPSQFELLPGTIDRANYAAGERRSGDRMICHGDFNSSQMGKQPILEMFRPRVYPLGQRVDQEQGGERPGRQSFLPLKVIFLWEEVAPFRAAVVGIRKSDILHTEAARRSR